MGMLTATALQGYKEYTRATISYARYKVGNTYYKVPIQSAEYLPNGKLAVIFLIDHAAPGNITITEIQIFDVINNLWLTKPENIMREDVTAGILYRITFDFQEN